MRLRRGNYSIIFVLTSAVMLSYLAFSIDGGRVKVATVQAENAAEAASLAALITMRDGGNRIQAEVAANAAANKVKLRRVGSSHNADDDDFIVDLDWGHWNWDEGRTSLDSRWEANNNFSQAVTANVTIAGGGLTNIFGPAIALVGGGANPSRRGEQRDTSNDFTAFSVTHGARAALRNRDIVVVVDVSRRDEINVDDLQAGLGTFFDELYDNRVPGDRIGMVAYAGEDFLYDLSNPGSLTVPFDEMQATALGPRARVATMVEPTGGLFPVDEISDDLRATLTSVESCDISSDVFYDFARFRPPSFDPERTSGAFSTLTNWFNYYAISPGYSLDPSGTGPNTTIHEGLGGFRAISGTFTNDDRDAALIMMNASAASLAPTYPDLNGDQCSLECLGPSGVYYPPAHPQAGTLNPACGTDLATAGFFTCLLLRDGGELGEQAQCAGWRAMHMWFLRFDPRRDRLRTTGVGSPLDCHDGNWFDGSADPDRIGIGTPIANLSCLAVGRPDAVLEPDRSLTLAGTQPGQGLGRALEVLEGRVSNGEPTVILLTNSKPRCGDDARQDPAVSAACTDEVNADAADALTGLRDMNANVYVFGLNPTADDEATLAGWGGIGRGYYLGMADPDDLGVELTTVANDMRIQVVQ
ncbi:MAG: hypothetical protein H6733_02230 [Alphaproteobacteria bacterium]|nr:hypothetical protein [Alphaproteobacteria bacterium]